MVYNFHLYTLAPTYPSIPVIRPKIRPNSEVSMASKRFYTDSMITDPGMPWKWRLMRAALGTTTGLIVMTILAKQPKRGPALGQHCIIDKEGWIKAQVRKDGQWVGQVRIGTVANVRDALRHLADHCKIDDAQRNELFEELRKWIKKDERATSGEPA